jgi:predicted nucleotidyltransferase
MIISVFQSNPLVTEVILFGSRAKGNFKPGSDIDICLKGTNITYIVLKNLQTELDNLDLPWTIDLLHYESIPDPVVIEHIDRVGIKLV